MPLVPFLSTASASHSQLSPEATSAHCHPHSAAAVCFHRPAPSATYTLQQNHLKTEETQPLRAVDPLTTAAPASSGDEAISATEKAAPTSHPALLFPPQAATRPAPLIGAADLPSLSQRQEEADRSTSAPATVAPPPSEPSAATTTLPPLPSQGTTTAVAAASPLPPTAIQAEAAAAIVSDREGRLQELAAVLKSLWYDEMASAVPLLGGIAASPVARWPGAITVFAVPDDAFLQAWCRLCVRRRILLRHIALGYYPYSELVSSRTAKIPSASFGFCLNTVSEGGPLTGLSLYVNGVEVSYTELYNDGRYVVHGLNGFLRPLSTYDSCYDHSTDVRSADTSAATATPVPVVYLMIRDAVARLIIR